MTLSLTDPFTFTPERKASFRTTAEGPWDCLLESHLTAREALLRQTCRPSSRSNPSADRYRSFRREAVLGTRSGWLSPIVVNSWFLISPPVDRSSESIR